MSHYNPIITHLKHEGIAFTPLPSSWTETLQETAEQAQVDPEQVARAVLFADEEGPLLAVLPLNRVIDFKGLFTLAGRPLETVGHEAAQYVFRGCEPGTIPPLATPFGLNALVDTALFEHETIYIEPGRRGQLLRLDGSAFRQLHKNSTPGRFSTPETALSATDQAFANRDAYARHHRVRQLRPVEGMKERIKLLRQLPPISPIGTQLLSLYGDPDAEVEQLVQVIETDPSISAQLLRHARSPYYGYRGELETVEQAITQVLGFDTAINTALGLSTLKPFDLPREGPLGLNKLWRSAIHVATLCHSLSSKLPHQLEVRPGQAYLAGLLHNLGFLALGHLLKPEYFLLNRVVEANPEVPLTLVEKRTLGIDHTRIGTWLMRTWHMPEMLHVVAREHHNETYQSEYWTYANLVLIANCLLKPYGLGDAAEERPPAGLLNALGLSLGQAREVAEQQMAFAQELDRIAASLAA